MENIMEERTLFHYTCCAAVLGLLSVMWVVAPADARITGITIAAKTSPAFGGQRFGTVGQYEQLGGTATGEIDQEKTAYRCGSFRFRGG
jgi:hypothetical protein